MAPADSIVCAAILFDLDGVLVDSRECVEAVWRSWGARHGIDPAHVIEVAHGRRTIETLRLVAPHLDAAAEAAALAETEATMTSGVHEVPGARTLLDALPADRWAVVTSGTRAIATHRLRHTGLPVPDVMVCAEDVRAGKPDPEGYLLAAARLGHDPAACVVIEDAPPGIEAARAGKIPSIGVAQTYPARALAAADLVVARLADLRVSRSGGRLRLYHEGADPGAAPRHREETDR